MRNDGYADGSWTILVQNYPSPIPPGARLPVRRVRLHATEHRRLRLLERGRTWANSTALPTINAAVTGAATDAGIANLRTLDLASAFNGRRLCENTVGLYEEKGLTSWTQAGAVDRTEWVNQIRTVSTCCSSSPYYVQESLHPNYWAQLATRSCVRQAWNGGSTRGGHLHDRRDRAAQRRAADDAALIRWSERIAWCFRLDDHADLSDRRCGGVRLSTSAQGGQDVGLTTAGAPG